MSNRIRARFRAITSARARRVQLITALTIGVAACATSFLPSTNENAVVFRIRSGSRPVALGSLEPYDLALKLGVYSSHLPGGHHAIHIHNACATGGPIVAGGRLPNIWVPATGVAVMETVVQNVAIGDFHRLTLVIHAEKDQGLTDPEMSVGQPIACGFIDVNKSSRKLLAEARQAVSTAAGR